MPKYFAGDYFQRAGFEGYQYGSQVVAISRTTRRWKGLTEAELRHTWPSLFIGSNETQMLGASCGCGLLGLFF